MVSHRSTWAKSDIYFHPKEMDMSIGMLCLVNLTKMLFTKQCRVWLVIRRSSFLKGTRAPQLIAVLETFVELKGLLTLNVLP